MAFHHRSQSEQYQPQASQQPQTIESIIREHTDSQQSLDQLFNPTTPSVPLRSRNLPRSFFDPGLSGAAAGASGSRFHSRSVSYGHQPQLQSQPPATGALARTSSTLAPMSDYNSNQSSREFDSNNNHDTGSMPIQTQQVNQEWYSPATSLDPNAQPTTPCPVMQPSAPLRHNHSCVHGQQQQQSSWCCGTNFHAAPMSDYNSNQSSREFVNYSSTNQSATGWSSSGYSSDDMSASGANFWASSAQPVSHNQGQVLSNQPYHQHQPMQTRPLTNNAPNGRLFEPAQLNAACPTNTIQQPALGQYGAQVFHGSIHDHSSFM